METQNSQINRLKFRISGYRYSPESDSQENSPRTIVTINRDEAEDLAGRLMYTRYAIQLLGPTNDILTII